LILNIEKKVTKGERRLLTSVAAEGSKKGKRKTKTAKLEVSPPLEIGKGGRQQLRREGVWCTFHRGSRKGKKKML